MYGEFANVSERARHLQCANNVQMLRVIDFTNHPTKLGLLHPLRWFREYDGLSVQPSERDVTVFIIMCSRHAEQLQLGQQDVLAHTIQVRVSAQTVLG